MKTLDTFALLSQKQWKRQCLEPTINDIVQWSNKMKNTPLCAQCTMNPNFKVARFERESIEMSNVSYLANRWELSYKTSEYIGIVCVFSNINVTNHWSASEWRCMWIDRVYWRLSESKHFICMYYELDMHIQPHHIYTSTHTRIHHHEWVILRDLYNNLCIWCEFVVLHTR